MFDHILELINNKNYNELKSLLSTMQAADIAILLSELTSQQTILVFRLLPKELAAEVFVYFDNDNQEILIKDFSDTELEEVFKEIFMDDIVDIVEEMPANVVKRILSHTDASTRSTINELLQYSNDSAGSIMTTEFVRLQGNITVKQAFDKIRKTGVDKETVYTCYVTDSDRTLIGEISVRTLLLSDYDDKIFDIMEHNVVYVKTTDDKEAVAKQMTKYDFIAMPVVDLENRLVGIVTIDDAVDVIEEEAEEDFALMAGLQPSEDSYFKTSVFLHAKNRIMWLLVLMLSATISGMIITKYEAAFAVVPILVSFIPMLTDTGGNCGSQTSTIIIRGLATEEIKLKDIFKVIRKELCISLIIGIVLAIVNSLRLYLMYHNSTDFNVWQVSIVVGIALIATVMMSKVIGCLLPMLAKKLNIDPAIMAAPIVTTLVDTFSILIFFNVAMVVLHL